MRCCADCLRSALAEAAPTPPGRLRDPVELSIRPSRHAQHAGSGFLALCLLHAWQMQHHGAMLPSAMVILGAATMGWGGWRLLRTTAATSLKLCLYPDGRAGMPGDGLAEGLRLAPCSLWLGGHVLLVLRGTGRRRLLLLGPGMLSAGDYAALRRWLHRAPGVLR